MPQIPVVIAVPAHMSSVLRRAVVDEMHRRFSGLTVSLEEQAVLVPRFARFARKVDETSKTAINSPPAAITKHLASAFPLVRAAQSTRDEKAGGGAVAQLKQGATGSISADPVVPFGEQVAALARRYWEEEGRPEGRADEHWIRAETQLRKNKTPHPGPSRPESHPR